MALGSKCSKREFKSKGERAEYLREVELANALPPHPNVVEYYRAWQESQVFCVQMELCAGGELVNFVAEGRKAQQELPEDWAATAVRLGCEIH